MNTSKPENICKICQKAFTRKADCTRHARLHAGIKPYRCNVEGCGKRFAQYTALKTHGNVHTGLKPFKCGFAGCRSTFGDPSSCTRHRKEMHCPRQPYECFFPGCKSSILRSSAFKTHLKKRHGEQYVEMFKRNDTSARVGGSTGPNGIEEERATIQSFSCDQLDFLPSLPDAWASFLSLPEDACGVIDTSSIRGLTSGHVTTAVSMGMQAGLSPGVSSPLVLSPCPRIAPSRDTGYFLSPPRAPSLTSSQYSSPMLPTPALTPIFTPTIGLGFPGDVGAQMGPCLATQDWSQVSWQDAGTQFVG